MPSNTLGLIGGNDPEKKQSAIRAMLKEIASVKHHINRAYLALLSEKKPSVEHRDILSAFQDLTRAEDKLWHLRDFMDEEDIGYIIVRQLDDLLSDINTPYSIPKIQLSLRMLIQSKQQIDSHEGQEKIILAHKGLRNLQREISSLERDLKRDLP